MKPLLTVFVALVFTYVPNMQAQKMHTQPGEVVWQLAAKQVVVSLRSDLTHVRSQTLKNVIVFSTLYRDRMDLESTVKAVAEVAENDPSEQNQRLAMAALQAIGSFRARQHLADLEGIADNEYRTLVASVLNEYYTKPNAF